MLTHIILPLLVATSVVMAGHDIPEEVKDEIDVWNLCSRCYGEQTLLKFTLAHHKANKACMGKPTTTSPLLTSPDVVRNVRLAALPAASQQYASFLPATAGSGWGNHPYNPFLLPQPTFGRYKRQVASAGLLQATPEDFAEFMAHADQLKASMQTKVGNLSCVLNTMGMLDAAGNVRLEHFTVDMWNAIGQNGGGRDPVFVQKMRDGFTDCYNAAQSWPQSSLDRSPISKQWGRQMLFFKCAKKMEIKTCSQLQIKEWLEALYGPIDMSKFPGFTDVYEAASFGLNVKRDMETPEEEMVRTFLWGNPNRAH